MTPQNAASHLGLFRLHREISSKNEIKRIKITPNTPKNESGLIQLIMMGESIRQIWVNIVNFPFLDGDLPRHASYVLMVYTFRNLLGFLLA